MEREGYGVYLYRADENFTGVGGLVVYIFRKELKIDVYNVRELFYFYEYFSE